MSGWTVRESVTDPTRHRAKCVVCRKRINVNWDPYCCQVCSDSDEASSRREFDRLKK